MVLYDRAVNAVFSKTSAKVRIGGILILFHASKIAEMKRSDLYDFVESKKIEIGSVEKYFRASQRCEILGKSGKSLDFRHRFPRFWTKNCPGHPKF